MSWIVWLILAVCAVALFVTFGIWCCIKLGSEYDKACVLNDFKNDTKQ